jgi:hypothetical protein
VGAGQVLRDLLDTLTDAATDDTVRSLVVRIGRPANDWAMAGELRDGSREGETGEEGTGWAGSDPTQPHGTQQRARRQHGEQLTPEARQPRQPERGQVPEGVGIVVPREVAQW